MSKTGGPAYPGHDLIAIWQKVYEQHLEYSRNPASAVDNANRAVEALSKAMADDELLDLFAAQVIAGLASQPDIYKTPYGIVAKIAYKQAEAMIAEKAKRESHE